MVLRDFLSCTFSTLTTEPVNWFSKTFFQLFGLKFSFEMTKIGDIVIYAKKIPQTPRCYMDVTKLICDCNIVKQNTRYWFDFDECPEAPTFHHFCDLLEGFLNLQNRMHGMIETAVCLWSSIKEFKKSIEINETKFVFVIRKFCFLEYSI